MMAWVDGGQREGDENKKKKKKEEEERRIIKGIMCKNGKKQKRSRREKESFTFDQGPASHLTKDQPQHQIPFFVLFSLVSIRHNATEIKET